MFGGFAAGITRKRGDRQPAAQVFYPLLDSPVFLAGAGGAPLRSKKDSLGAVSASRLHTAHIAGSAHPHQSPAATGSPKGSLFRMRAQVERYFAIATLQRESFLSASRAKSKEDGRSPRRVRELRSWSPTLLELLCIRRCAAHSGRS